MGDPKKDSAITLIALVITIIVLLILAGLTLTFVLGENGLFGKARNAKIETDKAQAIEDIKLKILEVQADAAQEGRTATLENLYNKLKEEEQEYEVTQRNSPSATLATGSISEWNSSITALNIKNIKYDYVVEVGSSLQIENDVQTASNNGNTSPGGSNANQNSSQQNNETSGNTSNGQISGSAITVNDPSLLNLSTSLQKISFTNVHCQAGDALTLDSTGGIKVGSGINHVLVDFSCMVYYATNGDIINYQIGKNSTQMSGGNFNFIDNGQWGGTNLCKTYIPQILIDVEENDIIYIYGQNLTSSRGSIGVDTPSQTRLTVTAVD